MEHIRLIQRKAVSCNWANQKCGYFKFNSDNTYQFIETDREMMKFLIAPSEISNDNCPVLASGFSAYLIKNIGKVEEQVMFESYFKDKYKVYEEQERYQLGASKRDLLFEFVIKHNKDEQEHKNSSRAIYEFVANESIDQIETGLALYFEYISTYIPARTIIHKGKQFPPSLGPDHINQLFNELRSTGYIYESTSIDNFRYVMGDERIPKDFQPINWLGTQQDLREFVNEFHGNTPSKWNITASCFTLKGKSIKQSSIKQNPSTKEDPPSKAYFRGLRNKWK